VIAASGVVGTSMSTVGGIKAELIKEGRREGSNSFQEGYQPQELCPVPHQKIQLQYAQACHIEFAFQS